MKVVISAEEHAKIMHTVRTCDKEVSGLGLVKNINGTLYVTKIYILDQIVSSVETELNDQAIANQMYQAIQDREHGTLNFWWHSHVNMGVFWSGTDRTTKEKISKNGWFLSTVFNKKGEMKSCFNQGASDYYPSLEIDDLQTTVEFILAPEVLTALDAEIEAKVKEQPMAKHWYGHGKHNAMDNHYTRSWYDGYDDMDDDLPVEFKRKSFWEDNNEFDNFAARAVGRGFNNRAFDLAEQRRAERELTKAERKAAKLARSAKGQVYITPNGEQITTKETLITRENGWNVTGEAIERGGKNETLD